MKLLFFLQFMISITFCQNCPLKKDIVNTLSFFSCERGQNNYFQAGERILQDQVNPISQLTVVGWYNLKGKLNEKYLIFQAFYGKNDHIFSLALNPVDLKAYSTVYNENEESQIIPTFANDLIEKWFFVRIGINLQQDNVPNYRIYYLIETISYPVSSPYYKIFTKISSSVFFQNQDLQIFYGNSANYPYSASCAFTKKVTVYIGIANGISDLVYKKASPQERFMPAELVLQINYAIQENLPNNLTNMANTNSPDRFYTTTTTSYLNYFQYLMFGQFNFEEQGGITLSFNVKIGGTFANARPELVYLSVNQNFMPTAQVVYTLTAYLMNGSTIYLYEFFFGQYVGLVQLLLNTWYTITVVFSLDFNKVVRQFYLNNVKILENRLNYSFIGQFTLVYCNIGYAAQGINRFLYLKQIKLYQGSYYNFCGNCLIQMNNNVQDCLVCQGNSDFTIQGSKQQCNSFSCPSGYLSDVSNRYCEWQNGSACPVLGQIRYFDNNCTCLPGYYLKGNDCLVCPDFCITCSSEKICDEYLYTRPISGDCENNKFDDGKQCISNFFKIPNRKNTLGQPKQSIIDCLNLSSYTPQDFLIKDPALNLKNKKDSVFIQFSFSLLIIQPVVVSTTYTICQIKDQQKNIFTLIAKVQSQLPLLIEIHLYYLSQLLITAPIENVTVTWIGLLFDLTQVKLVINQTNSPTSTYTQFLQSNTINQLFDVQLYYGGLGTLFSQYPLCGQIFSYLIMKGDISMFEYPQILAQHQNLDLINYVDFNFCEYSEDEIKKTIQIPQKSDTTKYFTQVYINNKFDKIKGLMFNSVNFGVIGFPKLTKTFSFSIVITPSKNSNYSIASLMYSTISLIQVNLLANKTGQRAIFSICIANICKSLKETKIALNKTNFIFMKIEIDNYSSLFELVSVDTVVNYQLENIKIQSTISPYFVATSLIYFKVGNGLLGSDSLFYLSRFQFYFEGFYYLDYDLSDPCFLYIDRQNMKCIHPKQGYALIDGQKVIKSNQCNLGRGNNQTLLFYNPFSYHCQDSNIKIFNCVEIAYDNLLKCLRCKDSLMDENNSCSCPNGTFYDTVSEKCLNCHPKCNSCKDTYDNCLTCVDINAITPTCKCPLLNQFQDQNYFCQDCDPQCQQCSQQADYCTVCSEGRIELPICRCDSRFYRNQPTDPVSKDCESIECDFKCKTCLYKSDNCTFCRGDRQGLPSCQCQDGKYEDPYSEKENCSFCQTSEYYDTKEQICIACSPSCLSCFGPDSNNCLLCQIKYSLNDKNECECSEGFQMMEVDQFTSECFQYTNLLFDFQLVNGKYQIMIQFEEEISDLNSRLLSADISSLMELRINEIEQKSYGIQKKFIVNNNSQLILFLELKESFQATSGIFIFKDNKFFKNTTKKVVLDPAYLKRPFNFNIGPYLFVTDKTNTKVIEFMQQNTLKSSSYLAFIQKFQFLLYVLNSVQPTAMFLLVKTNIPINLYSFLQMIGIFVYNDVPDYQQPSKRQGFYLFGYKIDEYIKSSGNTQFDRLGFTDCLVVSCEIIFYKYLFLIFAICLTKGVILFNYQPKILETQQNKLKKSNFYQEDNQKQNQTRYSSSLYTILIQRLSKENEVNMMVLILSALIQFQNIDSLHWLNRWSTYTTIIIIGVFIGSSLYFYKIYNSKNILLSPLEVVEHFYIRLKLEIQSKGKIAKNYNFICQIKKILLIIVLFLLVESPTVVCCVGIILNIATAILTLYLLPYKYLVQSIIKLLGDILLTITWIFMILFQKFNEKYKGQSQIPQEEIDVFFNYGFYAIICLTIFNLLFLINFIFEGIILSIYQIIIAPKEKYFLIVNKKSKSKNEKSQLIPLDIKCKQLKSSGILV